MSETPSIVAAINAGNVELLKSLYPNVITLFYKLADILVWSSMIHLEFSYEMMDYLMSIDNKHSVLTKAILNRLMTTANVQNLNKLRYLLDHIHIHPVYFQRDDLIYSF